MTTTYRTTARNWATESENKIHDDAVARRYGFAGGLVPGVTLFAYLVQPVAAKWGVDWLGGGRMDVRFLAPVYAGDDIACELASDGDLALRNPAGRTCAAGCARLGATGSSPADIPYADLPAQRPRATPRSLATGTVLGTVERRYDAETAATYLDQIGAGLALFRDDGYAHPGWLLQGANEALRANVVLNPWLHVESRTAMLRPVRLGQVVQTRARVAGLAERKGHRFVDLDVVMLADGEPAMAARHTAIYEPRRPDQPGMTQTDVRTRPG